MRKWSLLVVVVLMIGGLSATQKVNAQAAPAEEVPAWFLEHVEELTAEGGRWITSNTEHKSEQEPFEAYGMEWRKGIGGKSAMGFMFALSDGNQVGPLWEFRTAWHPGESRVLAMQFGGDGTFGTGEMTADGKGGRRMVQEFFKPGGGSFEVGHEETLEDGVMGTQSFDVLPDGSWMKRRYYVWEREKVE